jgi:tRNA threonylcarbamoyladenosine biosynthesis protein TsaE
MQHTTTFQDQTIQLGRNLATKLKGGDIVLLHGDLGAGKTTLVKGIAEGLGVTDDIVSPTFTLMNLYPVPSSRSLVSRLVHVDTYRLENENQLIEIGIEDYLGEPNTVFIIEWPEKLKTLLQNKKSIIHVTLGHLDENQRSIIIQDSTV